MTRLREIIRDNPRHVLAGCVVAGLAFSRLDPVALFVLAALVLILLSACESRPHVVVAASGLVLLGAGVGTSRVGAIDADPLAGARTGPIELRGNIIQRPREGRTGTTIRLRARAFDGRSQTIEVRSFEPAPPGLRIGDELLVRGSLREVSVRGARTPEAASYARFLLRSGVRRRMHAKSIVSTGNSREGPVGAIDAIRNRADRALALGLDPEPAALLRGMVLGGDAGLPEATAEDFRVAGLSHILTVNKTGRTWFRGRSREAADHDNPAHRNDPVLVRLHSAGAGVSAHDRGPP